VRLLVYIDRHQIMICTSTSIVYYIDLRDLTFAPPPHLSPHHRGHMLPSVPDSDLNLITLIPNFNINSVPNNSTLTHGVSHNPQL